MYLVACHSDASVYSLTNSPEWLHGGLWLLDRIVVVGYDESLRMIFALNGQEVISLMSFNEINFEGV